MISPRPQSLPRLPYSQLWLFASDEPVSSGEQKKKQTTKQQKKNRACEQGLCSHDSGACVHDQSIAVWNASSSCVNVTFR